MTNIGNGSTNEVTAGMLNEFNDKKESASNELKSTEKAGFKFPCSNMDLVVDYYPKYYSSDEIARNDDLCRFIDDELTDEEIIEKFGEDYDAGKLSAEFYISENEIFQVAIKNFAEAYHKWEMEQFKK